MKHKANDNILSKFILMERIIWQNNKVNLLKVVEPFETKPYIVIKEHKINISLFYLHIELNIYMSLK